MPSIAKTLATLALAAAIAAAAASSASAIMLDRVVAVVNKEAITWLELYARMRKEFAPRLKGMTREQIDAALKQNEAAFLDRLITQRLQLQEARRVELTASYDDIDRAIDGIRANNNMDLQTFKRAIMSEGLEWDVYRGMLGDQITLSRLIDRAVKSRINPDEPEVKQLASANTETTYHLRQIFFRGSDASVRERVEAALKALASGKQFEEVAANMSDGPEAARGGDLGSIRSGQLSPVFVEALKGLAPGAYTQPFRVRSGVIIIQVVDSLDPMAAALEYVFQKRLAAWLKELRSSAYIEIKL